MEPNPAADPERLWEDVLSRDEPRVRRALGGLSEQDRADVIRHLRRMASDAGWHPGQRESARAALTALSEEDR